MSIGNTMRNIRKEKRMTLQQIADAMGCSPQLISQYESGKRQPKLETKKKIATALNVPLYELMGFDGSIQVNPNPEIERLDTEIEELIKRQASGENLTKEERKKIFDYIERTKESFFRNHESVESIKNVIEGLGENVLLSDYRELNVSGKTEAQKRIHELTEIPRYTKPDAPKTNPPPEEQ